MKNTMVGRHAKGSLAEAAKRRAAGIMLLVTLLTVVCAVGCGKENANKESGKDVGNAATVVPAKSSEVLPEGAAGILQPEEGMTAPEVAFDPERPVVFGNTWKGLPGEVFVIRGTNFVRENEKTQVYLAPMSGYEASDSFDLYELNIVNQEDNVLQAEVPMSVPADNYIGYIICGDKVSNPFCVNTPELDWVSDLEICAGMSVRVFGRNLLNPKTGTIEGASLYVRSEDGTQMHQAEIKAATEYTVDFIIPDGVTEGTGYTLQYNNGACGYGIAELNQEEELMQCLSNAQFETLKELYGVEVAWASQMKLADVFNVKDYGAVGDGIAEDQDAFKAALAAAGKNGGGIVYLPEGTYNMMSATTEFAPRNKIIIAGDGQDKTTILTCQAIVFRVYYGGITRLTLQSDRTRPEGDTVIRNNGYDGKLLHAGLYSRLFAKNVGIKAADGSGFLAEATAQVVMEDCTIDCSHWGVWLNNSSGLYRKKLLNSYVKNTQRPLLTVGSYTWVDGNRFEGASAGDRSEKGEDGQPATGEHRICDMSGDAIYYGNNTILGTFGNMQEAAAYEDTFGKAFVTRQATSLGTGTVRSVFGLLLTSADQNYTTILEGNDPIAGSRGNQLIGARVCILSGKGTGQSRTIIKAFGKYLVLEEEWAYPPQEGDTFAIDYGIPERSIIVNNDIGQ